MKEPKREREMMGYGKQEFTLRGKEESFGVNQWLNGMVWWEGSVFTANELLLFSINNEVL